MSDRDLILAYAQGRNVGAFDEFVARHQDSLLSFSASIVKDHASAQDVVQEAFLRVARHPKRLLKVQQGPAGERNWLLKVVRDLSIDSLRRRAAEGRVVEKVARQEERTAPSADEVFEGQERQAQVLAAIDRLPPRLRELLALKIREQKSYKEIAQITGLSVTNVGFLLHQAMKRLSGELKD